MKLQRPHLMATAVAVILLAAALLSVAYGSVSAAPALVNLAQRPVTVLDLGSSTAQMFYLTSAQEDSGTITAIEWDGSQYSVQSLNAAGAMGVPTPIGLEATTDVPGSLPYAVDGADRIWLSSGTTAGYVDPATRRFVGVGLPAIVAAAVQSGSGVPFESREGFQSKAICSMVTDPQGRVWAADFDNHVFRLDSFGAASAAIDLSLPAATTTSGTGMALSGQSTAAPARIAFGFLQSAPQGLLLSSFWSSDESTLTTTLSVGTATQAASTFAVTGDSTGRRLSDDGARALVQGTDARIQGSDDHGVWLREPGSSTLQSVDQSGSARTANLDGISGRPDAIIKIAHNGDVWYWAQAHMEIRRFDSATGNVYRYLIPTLDGLPASSPRSESAIVESSLVDHDGNLWITYLRNSMHIAMLQR